LPEKKRVAGVVDRVEGHVAVVVVRDPNTKEPREIYVDKRKMKKVDLKEGDPVSVEMFKMTADTKSDTVSLNFTGLKSGEMAKRFFTYLVDGGLEDQLIQELSGKGITLEISDNNKKNLTVTFQCSKENLVKQTAKKTIKKPAKKPVKAPAMELREFAKKHKIPVKKPVKKVAAKRGKKA